MNTTRTALTAETVSIGQKVVKTPTSKAIFEITEIKVETRGGKEYVMARVRKQSATKGGLYYRISDLYTA